MDRLHEISMLIGTNAADSLRRFLIRNNPNSAGLSRREIDCLYYLTKGMTIKEIARNISLSPRTVEHYLESAKLKLNCRTRAELINKSLLLMTAD
jgi:DNA-binding CsgD family transcriptional regulator